MTLREWFRYYRNYYRVCHHRSHRLRLRCLRWHASDGYCAKHNGTCWHSHDWRVPYMTDGSRGKRSSEHEEA